MSDLARRRDARELWVSRSQTHAALVASVLVSVITFGLGYMLGSARTDAVAAPPEQTLLASVPGEDLVALLAKVERGTAGPASSAIVYPELIDDQEPLAVPKASEDEPGVDARLEPSRVGEMELPDVKPPGEFTIDVGAFDKIAMARDLRDHLVAQELQAWWTVERIDGVASYRVLVGGFSEESAATADLTRVAAVLETSPVTPGAPRVTRFASAR